MSEPMIGFISMCALNFAPVQYAQCDGQTIAITSNQALYSLLGTQFGGDGRSTFALPDLRGRTPVGFGDYTEIGVALSYRVADRGGAESVVLSTRELAAHTHQMKAQNEDGVAAALNNRVLGNVSAGRSPLYAGASNLVAMDANMTQPIGGSDSHANTQPSIAINFIIALQGIYPSRN